MRRSIITIPLLAFLLGCGGGGSNQAVQPPMMIAENIPPRVQFPLRQGVPEGKIGLAFTFSSTDGDRDQRTHEISGPDASFFELSAPRYDGTSADIDLILKQALDFEKPVDANGDGIYDVTVTVSDGKDEHSIISEIVVSDTKILLEANTLLDGYQSLVGISVVADATSASGIAQILAERAGVLHYVKNAGIGATSPVESSLMLDISADISTAPNSGLLDIERSADFSTDQLIYLSLINVAGNLEVVSYEIDANDTSRLDPTSRKLILAITEVQRGNYAGKLQFLGDGSLLILTGDGDAAVDIDNPAQSKFSLLGKVLRIDVTQDDFPTDSQKNYGIVSSNPYADGIEGAQEIIAMGLRNPTGLILNPTQDVLFVSDKGEGRREEISKFGIETSAVAAVNLGWPYKEGTVSILNNQPVDIVDPLVEYAHGTDGNHIVTGAFLTNVNEDYLIFGDMQSGNAWSLQLDILDADVAIGPTDFASIAERTPLKTFLGVNDLTSLHYLGWIYATTEDGRIIRYEAPLGL